MPAPLAPALRRAALALLALGALGVGAGAGRSAGAAASAPARSARAATAALWIVEAGASAHRTRDDVRLPVGQATPFCARAFSHKGLSVDCRGAGVRPPVMFVVNGRAGQTERFAPFAIKGDVNGSRFAWRYRGPHTARIECWHAGGPPVRASVRFKCPEAPPTEPTVRPKPPGKALRGPFATRRTKSAAAPNLKRKPVPRPKPTRTLPPRPTRVPRSRANVRAKGSTKTSAMPPSTAGSKTMSETAPEPFSTLEPTAESTPESAPAAPLGPARKSVSLPSRRPRSTALSECVVIRALNFSGDLPKGWTPGADGLTYRAGDAWEGVEAAGTAALTYSFGVPVAARYAVTLDMTSRHWTEHNDVFLRFRHGDGLVLRKAGGQRAGGRDFLKAYHNRNGRATQAFSVDNDAHAFSTADRLAPGDRYYITVGARSTMLTLHRIILFPCDAAQCNKGSAHFQNMVAKCT